MFLIHIIVLHFTYLAYIGISYKRVCIDVIGSSEG